MMHHDTDTRTNTAPPASPTTLLAAALDAAERGWSVLPCHARGPRAKSPIGRLVPHGHLDATRDPATITRWWSGHPAAMVGAAVPDTVLVLDVDPRNGGSREALEAVLGPLPPTLYVLSGREDGGAHLYYRRPPGALVATALPAGVDLKVNGYVILPPSIHPATGRPYTWKPAPFAHLPTAAVIALRPPSPPRAVQPLVGLPGQGSAPREASAAGLVRTVAQAEQGDRNAALYWAARRALHGGYDDAVLAELTAAAIGAGLAEREVAATITSARRAHGARR